MSELRTRMIRDMALRGFSPRTHESYVAAVVRLAKYYHRSPDQLTDDGVQNSLARLRLFLHARVRLRGPPSTSGYVRRNASGWRTRGNKRGHGPVPSGAADWPQSFMPAGLAAWHRGQIRSLR